MNPQRSSDATRLTRRGCYEANKVTRIGGDGRTGGINGPRRHSWSKAAYIGIVLKKRKRKEKEKRETRNEKGKEIGDRKRNQHAEKMEDGR